MIGNAFSVERSNTDRNTIRAAMSYRSHEDSLKSVYLGSMERAQLGFDDRLRSASRHQLDRMLLVCSGVIARMLAYPTKPCPHCGQVMPE